MAGGVLQLVARSPDDIYLINDPQITLFKTIYRRYSNFSIDNKTLKFNKNVSFNSKGVCNLKKQGDLLHKLFLVINLPEIDMIYNSLTYEDVYNILYSAGIIWIYKGKPTDLVKESDLPSIEMAIIDAIYEYETNNVFIQSNNIIPLNELYNYYLNNTVNPQTGIYFLQNYIGGINSFNGIIYNEDNSGNPLDKSITKSLLSEYNFSESYKYDISDNLKISLLGDVQNSIYLTFFNYIIDYQYMFIISDKIAQSINKLNTLIINLYYLVQNNSSTILNYVIPQDFMKNQYIKFGLQENKILKSNTNARNYSQGNVPIELYNNFDYVPLYASENFKILSLTSYIYSLSDKISNLYTVITSKNNLFYADTNYYQNLYCKINNNDNIFKIINYQNNKIILDRVITSYISSSSFNNMNNITQAQYEFTISGPLSNITNIIPLTSDPSSVIPLNVQPYIILVHENYTYTYPIINIVGNNVYVDKLYSPINKDKCYIAFYQNIYYNIDSSNNTFTITQPNNYVVANIPSNNNLYIFKSESISNFNRCDICGNIFTINNINNDIITVSGSLSTITYGLPCLLSNTETNTILSINPSESLITLTNLINRNDFTSCSYDGNTYQIKSYFDNYLTVSGTLMTPINNAITLYTPSINYKIAYQVSSNQVRLFNPIQNIFNYNYFIFNNTNYIINNINNNLITVSGTVSGIIHMGDLIEMIYLPSIITADISGQNILDISSNLLNNYSLSQLYIQKDQQYIYTYDISSITNNNAIIKYDSTTIVPKDTYNLIIPTNTISGKILNITKQNIFQSNFGQVNATDYIYINQTYTIT